ncbi:hypothetical protein G7Z17_g12220 [Cylindrodendrum hubeiense]|uniref:PA14 domain-containing protein n=1 Tax=Cylindrodendrum hubeiense TaxID=595255 RepID=A0A9P5H2F8_9HYPO|nr:hypothetical protein G7Z17_g12220 [Cylindrodendrum hubeiense]
MPSLRLILAAAAALQASAFARHVCKQGELNCYPAPERLPAYHTRIVYDEHPNDNPEQPVAYYKPTTLITTTKSTEDIPEPPTDIPEPPIPEPPIPEPPIPEPPIPEPTPDLSCDNQGLDYAIFDHDFYNGDFDYTAFNTDSFKTKATASTGETNRIGIIPNGASDSAVFKVYDDSPERLLQYTAIAHRGFLYAPVTGTYTITVPESDDITLVWLGNNALTEWTRSNANIVQPYVSGAATAKTAEITLEAGTYNPLRVLWGNGQGGFQFIITVKAPNGDSVLDGTSTGNGFIVRFACDGTTPVFQPFGSGG